MTINDWIFYSELFHLARLEVVPVKLGYLSVTLLHKRLGEAMKTNRRERRLSSLETLHHSWDVSLFALKIFPPQFALRQADKAELSSWSELSGQSVTLDINPESFKVGEGISFNPGLQWSNRAAQTPTAWVFLGVFLPKNTQQTALRPTDKLEQWSVTSGTALEVGVFTAWAPFPQCPLSPPRQLSPEPQRLLTKLEASVLGSPLGAHCPPMCNRC